MQRKTRTVYSNEFKQEALRMVAVGNRSKTQIANELGIRVNKLRYWSLEFKKSNNTDAKTMLAVGKVAKQQQNENVAPKAKAPEKRRSQIDSKKGRNTVSVSSAARKSPGK